jgi:hypothetical protein
MDKANENVAMLASKGGRGKKKGKQKVDSSKVCMNPNCLKVRHIVQNCFQKGGGKEGQVPWDRKKRKVSTANTALTNDDEDVALITTVGLNDELALSMSRTEPAIIINCGAMHHFSSNHEKFTTFMEITPQPIKSADS